MSETILSIAKKLDALNAEREILRKKLLAMLSLSDDIPTESAPAPVATRKGGKGVKVKKGAKLGRPRKTAAKSAPKKEGRRTRKVQPGLQEAILEVIGSQPMTTPEIAAKVRAKGFDPKNVPNYLSRFKKEGRLENPKRGKYMKAKEAPATPKTPGDAAPA